MDRLTQLQVELKNRLLDGADVALKHLGEAISPTSSKFNIYIQLRSRYSAYLSAIMVGGSSPEELEKVYNHITFSFTSFVDSLTINDLKPIEPAEAPAKPKRGELLYHIPGRMQHDREHACRVRVAYLLDELFRDWDEQPEQEQRNIRVAEIMSVEMLNIGENQAFSIRAVTETIQFLEAGEATEWLFYVCPLQRGAFPLLLKVSVIEVINGREVRKDVVIEERVVVSDDAATEPEVLKKAGVEVSMQTSENQNFEASQIPGSIPTPQPAASQIPGGIASPQPAASSISTPRNSKPMRTAAMFLALLMFSTVGMFAMTSPMQRGFWWASLQDTEKAYTDFIEKYKNDPAFLNSKQREKAYFRLAELSNDPHVLQEFLESFGEKNATPEHVAAISGKLKTLETNAVNQILANPTPENVKKYTDDFPKMDQFAAVVEAVKKRPDVATALLPILENAAIRQIQSRTAKPEKVKIYRDALPESTTIQQEIEQQPDLKNAISDLDSGGQNAGNGDSQTDGGANPSGENSGQNDNQSAGNQRVEKPIGQNSDPKKTGENKNNPSPPVAEPTRNRRSGFEMVRVEGGAFGMGDDSDKSNDNCLHSVSVKTFSIGKYEVTQADWAEVMGRVPAEFRNCDQCPVENVSWDDVQLFLKKTNQKFGGRKYRLPTEAEWEFAARGGHGGSPDKFEFSGSSSASEVAWHTRNSKSRTHPVGEKKANQLGIFDMSGNVLEWCQNSWEPYPCDRLTKPKTNVRVVRGGSWNDSPNDCRVAFRINNSPALQYFTVGFRLVRE